MELGERDLDGMAATRPPQLVDARADDESSQPCLELGRVAQTRQALPGPQQGLLDGIASEVGVPQRQPRDTVHPGQGVSSQRRERLPIPSLSHFHERSVPMGSLTCDRGDHLSPSPALSVLMRGRFHLSRRTRPAISAHRV